MKRTPASATQPAQSPAADATAAAWAEQQERSSQPLLRVARWIAVTAGRTAARGLLHPTVVFFLLTGPGLRRHSAAYLTRVLGRPAGWRDVYRHVLTFASVVLDRVYLLRERFGEFRVEASGIAAITEPFGRGEGVLAFGAHIGSFEALRMIGHQHGLRVAMIMYEDNARRINEALAAIAPQAELHTIALGRVDAMLAIHRWLGEGGIAGLLADRTVPGQSSRSRNVAISFLGAPALFPDGPFRLAAMLRQKVVFMAGLYCGGRDYDLRFAELADFGALPRGDAGARDAAIHAAMERYVEMLESLCREAPYNWFNFYDFWSAAASTEQAPADAGRQRSDATTA